MPFVRTIPLGLMCSKCKEEQVTAKGLCDNCYHKKWMKKTYTLARSRKWRVANRQRYMYLSARTRAKLKNVSFTIKSDELIIPKICPITNKEIELTPQKFRETSASIDYIIPKLGYVPGNVGVISMRANRIKNDATLHELKQLVDYVGSSPKIKELMAGMN